METRAVQVAQGIFATLRKQDFNDTRIGGHSIDLSTADTSDWESPEVVLYPPELVDFGVGAEEEGISVELRFNRVLPGLPTGAVTEAHVTVRWGPEEEDETTFISISKMLYLAILNNKSIL